MSGRWRESPYAHHTLPDYEVGDSRDPIADVAYGKDALPLDVGFARAVELNLDSLQRAVGDDVAAVQRSLVGIHRLACHFYPWLGSAVRAKVNPATPALFWCFHFALVKSQTALFLTQRGLYGPARPVIRQAYEALIIGKFCSVRHESTVFDRWFEDGEVWIGSDVFAELTSPDIKPLRQFWHVASGFTHAKFQALQPTFRIRSEDAVREVLTNLAFLAMLAECMYHVLSSHLATRSVRYYEEVFGDIHRARSIAGDLKSGMSAYRRSRLSKDAKRFVKCFKAPWTVAA